MDYNGRFSLWTRERSAQWICVNLIFTLVGIGEINTVGTVFKTILPMAILIITNKFLVI